MEVKIIKPQLKKTKIIIILFLALFSLIGCQSAFNRNSIPKNNNQKTKKIVNNKTEEKTIDSDNHMWSTEKLGNLGKPFAQPMIYNQTIVWAGDKDGSLHNADAIYKIDINNKKKEILASTRYNNQPYISCPQIDQNWITWLDSGVVKNKPQYSLMVMNRKTKKIVTISNFPAFNGNSHIIAWDSLNKNRLVWFKPVGKNLFQLMEYDLSKKSKKPLIKISTEFPPAPYQTSKYIIWEDGYKSWNGNLKIFKISSQKIIKSIKIKGRFGYPHINGSFLVFSPQETQNSHRSELRVVNIKTNKMSTIQTNQPYYWSIGNGFVTWSNYNNNGSSTVNIQTIEGKSKKISFVDGSLPYAYGNKIIWQSKNGNEINLTTINNK